MSTLPVMQQVRWQDFKVKNEIDMILEIAQQEGWEDCEIFGYGDMITEPQELIGWKLIPADLYEYSIPSQGIGRLHKIINAGVRIQGVIIADDEHKTAPAPTLPRISLPSVKTIGSTIRRALLGILFILGAIAVFSLFAISLFYLAPLLIVVAALGLLGGLAYDPKLVILVEGGNGGTAWFSVYTWYE